MDDQDNPQPVPGQPDDQPVPGQPPPQPPPQAPPVWQPPPQYPPNLSPQYPQQPQPPQQKTGTNGMAVASLVLGILWIYGIGAVLALVFGYISRGQIERSGGTQAGRGLAIAGIVLGWIGVVGFVLFVILVATVDDPSNSF